MRGGGRLPPLCPPPSFPPSLPAVRGSASRAGPPPPFGSASGPDRPPAASGRRSAVPRTPAPARRGLPSPFSQADTARGWAPTGSGGSIPAASRLGGAADCGRIRRHGLPRPHTPSPRLRVLRETAPGREPGAGGREPGAGSREPGAGSREPRAESREPGAESREPDPRESGASRPRQFSRPPQIPPPAANLRNCRGRPDGLGASPPRPARDRFSVLPVTPDLLWGL